MCCLLMKICESNKEKETISQRKMVAQTGFKVITTTSLRLNIEVSKVVFFPENLRYTAGTILLLVPMRSHSSNVNEYMCREGLTNH